MFDTISQPNATPLTEDQIAGLLDAVRHELDGAEPVGLHFRDQHSNDVTEVRFSDGRTLMVKQGRFPWVAQRFRTARATSRLLRGAAGVVAPAPLPIAEDLTGSPTEAYWRIDLPTLEELWPTLPEEQRAEVFWSWGVLLRRVHRVVLSGYGDLAAESFADRSLVAHLEGELAGRLRPAVAAEWPGGLWLVDWLLGALPELEARTAGGSATLVHNDLHMGNVLCDTAGGGARCVGLLDLEAAFAGPPEADLANLEIMHGPLFHRPLPGPWLDWVSEGYGDRLDPWLRGFFRVYHLINMGFYSALVGHHEHAGEVAVAAAAEVERLGATALPSPRLSA
jgi:aminoglycoside phosphotransferase (APT) family kinase protein